MAFFTHKKIIKSNGVVKQGKTKVKFSSHKCQSKTKQHVLASVFGLLIGFINGFWGGGGGMVCVPTLSSVFHLPEKHAHATAILVMLPLSVSSLVVYVAKGNVQLPNVWVIASGFFVGGILGALLLKKINNIILQALFAVVILAAGVRMLF